MRCYQIFYTFSGSYERALYL